MRLNIDFAQTNTSIGEQSDYLYYFDKALIPFLLLSVYYCVV